MAQPPLMKEWLRRHHPDLLEHLTTTRWSQDDRLTLLEERYGKEGNMS